VLGEGVIRVVVFWITIATAGIATATPPPGPDASYEELVGAALDAREKKDYTTVLSYLKRAHALRPSPTLKNNLGRVLEVLGRYKEAHDIYKVVANDERAPGDLRALDAARASDLRDRLSKVWVVYKGTSTLYIDGKRYTKGEQSLAVGPHYYEYTVAGTNSVVLRRYDFAAGRRTRLKDERGGKSDGAVALAGSGVTSLAIDGYTLRSPLKGVKRVYLQTGRHTIAVARGSRRGKATVTLKAGDFAASEIVTSADPVVVPPPIVKPGLTASAWSQIAMGGVGVALVGVGTWMTLDAAGIRDDVENPQLDSRGVAVGITHSEAFEKQDDADSKATTGTILLGVGGAAAVTALIWWLADSAGDAPAPAVSVTPHPRGLMVRGSF